MSDEELNVALAKHLGWIVDSRRKYYPGEPDCYTELRYYRDPAGEWHSYPPDFCEDLNLCHEAALRLEAGEFQPSHSIFDYLSWLIRLMPIRDENGETFRTTRENRAMYAPARHRAEALLQTFLEEY